MDERDAVADAVVERGGGCRTPRRNPRGGGICQSGLEKSRGVDIRSLTTARSAFSSPGAGSAIRWTWALTSNVGSRTHQALDPVLPHPVAQPREAVGHPDLEGVAEAVETGSGSSKRKIPVTIIRLVGSSMWSQAVSTFVRGVPWRTVSGMRSC